MFIGSFCREREKEMAMEIEECEGAIQGGGDCKERDSALGTTERSLLGRNNMHGELEMAAINKSQNK